MQKGRFALPVVLAFRISLRVSEMEFAQSILQKIYIAAIFSKHQGCTYTDSCSISGLIIYQIDPATFLLSARLLCSVLVKASLDQIQGLKSGPYQRLFLAWRNLKYRSMRPIGRRNRLKGGSYVFICACFVARQRQPSAIQVLSGHVAGIDQFLMSGRQAPSCKLRDGLVAFLVSRRRYFMHYRVVKAGF